MYVVGIDGIPNGWIAVENRNGRISVERLGTIQDLLDRSSIPDIIAIDIPIGFLPAAQPGGRGCEQAARKFIGRWRSSSVFSSPCRAALAATTYEQALALNRKSSAHGIGLSKQSWSLFKKLREVDICIQRHPQATIIEVHPEVSFTELYRCANRERHPAAELGSKKKQQGQECRGILLQQAGFADVEEIVRSARPLGARTDDVLDACVACWTAERKYLDNAKSLPGEIAVNQNDMIIWY